LRPLESVDQASIVNELEKAIALHGYIAIDI